MHGCVLVAIVLLTAGPTASVASEVTVVLDRQTGLPCQLASRLWPQAGVLAAPLRFSFSGAPIRFGREAEGAAVGTTGKDPLTYTASCAGGNPAILTVVMSNQGKEAVKGDLTVHFAFARTADRSFVPGGPDTHRQLAEKQDRILACYRGEMGMPLFSVYSRERNWGAAVCAPLCFPVHYCRLYISRDHAATRVQFAFTMISVPPNETVERRLRISATQGDWRPALRAALLHDPKVFEVHNPLIEHLQGPVTNTNIRKASDQYFEQCHALGLRMFEIFHSSFGLWFGKYVPDDVTKPFPPMVDCCLYCLKHWHPEIELPPEDSPWREQRDFAVKHLALSHYGKRPITVEEVRSAIDRLERFDIRSLIYLCPTEVWRPWALEEFPDCVVYRGGKPARACARSVAMRVTPDNKWGRFYLEEIQRLFETYPNLDGAFFDQAANGDHEFTKWSMKATAIVRSRIKNGICYFNGPYNMELAALADGMMSEGGGSGWNDPRWPSIMFYTIAGKPCVSLAPPTWLAFKRCLYWGFFPSPSCSGTEHRQLQRRWHQVWRLLKPKRRWVLEAHALDADDRVMAEIWQIPKGNYLLPVVSWERQESSPDFDFDVQLSVKLPDAPSVKAAYVTSPDALGLRRLPLELAPDGTLRVVLPRLKTAAAVILARTGKFVALGDEFVAQRGKPTPIHLTADNWTDATALVEFGYEAGNVTKQSVILAPGASARLDGALPACDGALERFAFRMIGRSGTEDLSGSIELPWCDTKTNAEVWVDPECKVQYRLSRSRFSDRESAELRVTALSHAADSRELQIEVPTDAVECTPPARKLTCPPGKPAACGLRITPKRAGCFSVKVRVSAGEWSDEKSFELYIMATALRSEAFRAITKAALVFDGFGADGGVYANKPVYVNGVRIGLLPKAPGAAWITERRLEIPPEHFGAIGARNDIRIENAVKDCFNVRALRLELLLKGQIPAVSETNTNAYSSDDWLFKAGVEFKLGDPMTGIHVDFAIDETRPETYMDFFGTPETAEIVLEARDCEGVVNRVGVGVELNGVVLGHLPKTAAGKWETVRMPVKPTALATITCANSMRLTVTGGLRGVSYQVRNVRLRLRNSEGAAFEGETVAGPFRRGKMRWSPVKNSYEYAPNELNLVFRQ